MTFEEITKDEYQVFASIHPLKNYFQSVQMESISNLRNWKSRYVGIKRKEILIGAVRIVEIKNRVGQNYYYAPRGPLLDYNDIEVLTFFTENIKKYLKRHKGYVLHIDPLVIHKQRDIDGNIIEGGTDNSQVICNLKKLGYLHYGFNVEYNYTQQVRWVFCLNLDKSEEEIFANMRQSHRNIIRKTEKFGIEVKEITYDELNDFKQITKDTSERKHFNDKTIEYYQTMYKTLKDKVKFIIAYLNVDYYISNLENELKIESTKYDKSIKIDANSGKTKELKVTIDSLNKRLNEAKEILKKGHFIPLSAAMFVLYEQEISYLQSGSYKEYMNFYAQYAIQWYMIKYGLKNGFKKYNFYGITGNFDRKDPEYGVYEFKRGFNGYVEEYIGDFDLPITYFYKLKKFIK